MLLLLSFCDKIINEGVLAMPVFNAAKREIDIKIVYYGPALCGKTTNVHSVHKKLPPGQRGEIMALATKDDRTLFFDFLSIELGNVKGFKTRFHVYTVPGQVYYALTRRAVLTGVDGIIFVADSQNDKMKENIESLNDLDSNLKYYKKELDAIPFVIQYNKRDLENIIPVEEMNPVLNKFDVPFFEASAKKNEGVMETLTACCKIILKKLNRPHRTAQVSKEIRNEKQTEKTTNGVSIIQDTDLKITETVNDPVSETQESIDMQSQTPVSDLQSYKTKEPGVEKEATAPNDLGGVSIIEDTPSRGFSAVETEPLKEEENGVEINITETKRIDVDDSDQDVKTPLKLSEQKQRVEDEQLKTGFQIVACGMPQKISNTSIKIPLICSMEGEGKEFEANLALTVDINSVRRKK